MLCVYHSTQLFEAPFNHIHFYSELNLLNSTDLYYYFVFLNNEGFIVGAVDEMLQTLDDNAMNLQSMTASRFVGPFLENVQKWEKSLSHISEVVEVCMHIRLKSFHTSVTLQKLGYQG